MKAVLLVALLAVVAVSAFDAEVDVDTDVEVDAPTVPARVPASPLMKKKHVIIVPKGDPRARDPTPAVGAAAAGVPPISMDTSVPQGQWMSPAVDLVQTLKSAVGSYCANTAANVRAQPTTTGAVVLTTANGEAVKITAATEKAANGYTWIPVSVRGKAGWMVKTFVGACRSTTPTTPAAPTTPPTSTSPVRYPLFKQCGMSYSSTFLGRCSPTPKTICQIGCAMSSVAMILKARGYDTDPGRLNAWLGANGGYSGCAIYWSKVDALGKTRCQGFQNGNFATVCGWVKAGKGVVINVNGGAHWVLVTGCAAGNTLLVNDPGYNRASYPFSAVVHQVVYN